jgi:hypothetical protein
VLLLAGCPERSGTRDGGPVVSSTGARGLRLQLPEGWTAEQDAQGALLVGPPGRAVLRIAHSAETETEADLPSSEELREVFTSELSGARVKTLQSEDEDEGSLWVGRVEPEGEGASGWDVALGSRRVKGELFLCATLPGARPPEVQSAADLCSSL